MLHGKRILITGVMTHRSLAFGVAAEAQRQGAEVVLTSFGRVRRMTERAAKRLDEPADVLELDVTSQADLSAVGDELERRWGRLDGVLHAIAHAPPDALGPDFAETSVASAAEAFAVSAHSFGALAGALAPLLERGENGGSVVGLDFDGSRAYPAYGWMGVSKAALESVSRYLARQLGPRGVRVNLVASGPVGTPAANGIPGFDVLSGVWAESAPLGWDASRHDVVAAPVCFLLSDGAAAITGEILHVDGGHHAMGAPLSFDAAISANGTAREEVHA
jgi:enoyl-[acyl-carrier protein] reductase I